MQLGNKYLKIFINSINIPLYYFLSIFYKKINGANPLYILGSVFFTQKILGFNRQVPWPAHFSSKFRNVKNIKIGNRSFPGWGPGCYIQGKNGIIIGNNCRFAPNIGIISANHNQNDYDKWDKTDPIIIGDNVWVGMNSIIMPGVNIGSNVIIGAGSIVTKNIPSNSIAVGNPCKVIKEKDTYQGKSYA